MPSVLLVALFACVGASDSSTSSYSSTSWGTYGDDDDDAYTTYTPPEIDPAVPTGAALSASSTQTSSDGLTHDYEVQFSIVYLDVDGSTVSGIPSANVTLEDFVDGDFDVDFTGGVQCTERIATSPFSTASVVLAMDQSGSILDTDPDDMRLAGAREFLDSLSPPDEVNLFSFATNNPCSEFDITTWGDGFTTDYPGYYGTLDAFDGCEGGSTPLFDASVAAVDFAVASGAQEALAAVIFSDGADTASISSESDVINSARAAGVRVFNVGLSNGVNTEVLANISQSTDGAFFYADDIGPMITAFRGLNQLMTGTYTVYDCSEGLRVVVDGDPQWITTSIQVQDPASYWPIYIPVYVPL